MEKFVILKFPTVANPIEKGNRILRILPKKIVELYNNIRGPRSIDIILDSKSKVELGEIYSIPTLYYDGGQIVFENRERQLDLLIKDLREKNIELLTAPFIEELFTGEELEKINRSGISILDTKFYHMITLYICIPEILKILSRQLPHMDVGIWGGDTELGQVWAHMLAPYLNQMTIGGEDQKKLRQLSDNILKETGLSCELATGAKDCLEGKDLSITTMNIEDFTNGEGISIHSYPIDISSVAEIGGQFSFYSGFLGRSCEPELGIELNIWEQLALSNSLLYTLSGSYRDIISESILDRLTLDNFSRLVTAYGLKPRGVVNGHETITYDRFRMLYFKDHSSSKRVG